ncbi:SGNH/GDSL hydrolase family protein [Agrococcus sp. HG114]|uniref:SGNH/GDSL hydrolase family protein n=1 Tax=Agrococcus sp. HG114 TaxID=2969757 RepID=UPI00215AFA06|nr:SGNH/GDSL hydrolase family protein [Agrococcus sp. HG114]MCR8671506.1 SGNH/GDSL hydrolase family protein [Agrococcus sp. HG114]
MQRRSLALLAAALVGITGLAAAPATAVAPPDGAVYVALGDSEAAGTGNLPYTDTECLRSARAYPEQLATILGTEVVSLACTGASTDDVIATQLGALGFDTRLVTITVGINDLGWQAVLLECRDGGDPVACEVAKAQALAAIAQLPSEIAELLGAVRAQAPNAQIFVTGYPLLFGDLTSGTCRAGTYRGTPITFTAAETQFVNAAIEAVNAAIYAGLVAYMSATADEGVSYVDVTTAFDGHGLCDTGQQWVSGVVSGSATFDRSFHLNTAGMRAYAEILETVVPG